MHVGPVTSISNFERGAWGQGKLCGVNRHRQPNFTVVDVAAVTQSHPQHQDGWGLGVQGQGLMVEALHSLSSLRSCCYVLPESIAWCHVNTNHVMCIVSML